MPASRHISVNWTLGLAMLALGAAPFVRAAGQDNAAQPPVVLLTSQQDHDRQMRCSRSPGFRRGRRLTRPRRTTKRSPRRTRRCRIRW